MSVNITLFKKISAGLFIAFIFAAGLGVGVWAYSGTMMGRLEYHGYFTNTKDYYGGFVIREGIPTNINSVSGFINYLKGLRGDRPDINPTQKSTAAAFIVNTMLGKSAPGYGNSFLNDSDVWTELADRLNQSNIKIDWNTTVSNSSNNVNSFFQGTGVGSNPMDDAFYTESKSGAGIQISNKTTGQVYYRLLHACGNPIGVIPGIPPLAAVWDVIPSVSVSRSSANVGDSIFWTYKVTVANSAINTSVAYGWKNTGGSNTSSGQQGTLGSGTGVGQGATFTKSYTVQAGDAGKSLCGAAYSNPGWSDNKIYRESAGACVTVASAVVSDNPCRPIIATIPKSSVYTVGHPSSGHSTIYTGSSPILVGHTSSTGTPVTVKVDAYIGQELFGSSIDNSITTTNVLTSKFTTGDSYTITYKDRTSHIYKYTDLYGTRGKEIKYKVWSAAAGGIVERSWNPRKYEWSYTSTSPSYDQPTWGGATFGPCYDYSLTATLNNPNGKFEPGAGPLNVTPTITNSSYTAQAMQSFYSIYQTHSKSKNTKWIITQTIIQPNTAYPNHVDAGTTFDSSSTADFCSRFGFNGSGKSCGAITSGSTVINTSNNPSPSVGYSFTVPDEPAGTKICFAFSLYASQSDPLNTSSSWGGNDMWYHAAFDKAQNCIIVVKKPKVQVWGGDIWTKGSVSTSTSVKSGRTFGSWDEYGVLAPGSISGIASGSAFAGASGLSAGSICNYSTLTFTNGANAACSNLGNYTSAHTVPSVEANFPGGTVITSGTVIVNDLHN